MFREFLSDFIFASFSPVATVALQEDLQEDLERVPLPGDTDHSHQTETDTLQSE